MRLFLLALVFGLASALFEDQVGQNDWIQR
jgi:hypothetical protein